jgi:hypothetical protein
VDPHILCTPSIADIDGDGREELVVAVSYFYDREYYDDPAHADEVKGLDISKYIAGGCTARLPACLPLLAFLQSCWTRHQQTCLGESGCREPRALGCRVACGVCGMGGAGAVGRCCKLGL